MISTVQEQSYTNWELCIADGSENDISEKYIKKEYKCDSRIHYKRLKNNYGIAENTNEAIRYTAFHRFTDLWWRFGEELSVTHALFQRAGASLFTIFVLLLVLFRKKRVGLLFACIPVIIHNVLLFITIPAQDPRYALPAIECAIFIAALIPAIATLPKKTKEETQNSPL